MEYISLLYQSRAHSSDDPDRLLIGVTEMPLLVAAPGTAEVVAGDTEKSFCDLTLRVLGVIGANLVPFRLS